MGRPRPPHHARERGELVLADHDVRVGVGTACEQYLEARERVALRNAAVAECEERLPRARRTAARDDAVIAIEVREQCIDVTCGGGRMHAGIDERRHRREQRTGFLAPRPRLVVAVGQAREIDEPLRLGHFVVVDGAGDAGGGDAGGGAATAIATLRRASTGLQTFVPHTHKRRWTRMR